ncbi:hypothetical protein QTO34_010036 [Cnephaeus nilssonii]|uniref:Uncharacterized protein n=1 Tax=Cnephaeus nilssonii TaxID=3371016 RepID=A0AA40HES7_CNENI|nr:hypothetical protein QTO34_010036 [Eptesicus nilssonii]
MGREVQSFESTGSDHGNRHLVFTVPGSELPKPLAFKCEEDQVLVIEETHPGEKPHKYSVRKHVSAGHSSLSIRELTGEKPYAVSKSFQLEVRTHFTSEFTLERSFTNVAGMLYYKFREMKETITDVRGFGGVSTSRSAMDKPRPGKTTFVIVYLPCQALQS